MKPQLMKQYVNETTVNETTVNETNSLLLMVRNRTVLKIAWKQLAFLTADVFASFGVLPLSRLKA